MIVNACSTVLLPFFSQKNYESVNAKDEILIVWKNAFEKTIKLTYPLVMFFVFILMMLWNFCMVRNTIYRDCTSE